MTASAPQGNAATADAAPRYPARRTVAVFLRRRASECAGAVLVLTGLVLILALARYDSGDASLTTVTSIGDGSYRNLLGKSGADIAAMLVDYPGLIAAWALALLPVFWGARLLRHSLPARPRARLLMILPAILLVSFAAGMMAENLGGGLGGAFRGWVEAAQAAIKAPPPSAIFPEAMPEFFKPAIAALRWEHVITALITALALGSYVFAAAIGRGEMRLIPLAGRMLRAFFALVSAPLIRPGRAVMRGIVRLMGRETAATGDPDTMPRQKHPIGRREPVLAGGGDGGRPQGRKGTKRKSAKPGKEALHGEEMPSGYHLPPRELLAPPAEAGPVADKAVLDTNSRQLETVLAEFGVRGEISTARFGPVVTRYDLVLAPGIKTQRVIALADDIARSMSALSVRIALVPGQNVIGIELPNADRNTVLLRDLLDSEVWHGHTASLPLALGMDIAGKPVVADLARMPHLLVAGTTGSGKSVGINAMILSLLYTHTPETCRLIMIDPKMLELSVYDGIPHLLTPVVTDPGKAVTALKWTVREMEQRYRNMSKLGVRNIDGYNKRLAEARRKGEVLTRRVQTGFDSDTGLPVYEEQDLDLAPLPFIVVVIDEVADLMLVAGKDIEAAVQRLAQMARAAGIHVVMATQRPSVDVITGTIKANFPTRISFQVTSKIDSRTILGEQGAEQLLGKGDMLFMEGGGRIVRVHGPFIDEREVEEVTGFLREQGEPVYDDNVTTEAVEETDGGNGGGGGLGGLMDDGAGGAGGGGESSLYDEAVALVTREGKASTSFIQRHLRIGYNRAATIIEEMERKGVVSPANHAGKREVLVDEDNT